MGKWNGRLRGRKREGGEKGKGQGKGESFWEIRNLSPRVQYIMKVKVELILYHN